MKNLFDKDWLDKLEITDDNVILYHFGKKRGLTSLGPSHWGDNPVTPKNAATKGVVYFYTNTKDKERIIGGTPYKAILPLEQLYPFNRDPLNLLDKVEKEHGENLHHNLQWLYITEELKKMGYIGTIYKWEDTFLAATWIKTAVVEVNDGSNNIVNNIEIPKNDRIGWEIIDGLSTDPNLLSYEDKVRRVIATMKKSKHYSDDDMINYIQSMNLDINHEDVEIFEKVLLKPGKDGWDKYIELVAESYKKADDFDESEVWRWEVLAESNLKLWKRLLSRVNIIFVSSDGKYKDDGKIEISNKEYDVEYLESGQPYETQKDMKNDYINNGRLFISMDYSEHPIFSEIENIIFRAVHDFIIHIQSDVDFSGVGEIKAYNNHSKLLPPEAKPAAFTEVVGQASHYLTYGEFTKQKITLLEEFDYNDIGRVKGYDIENKELIKINEILINPYKNYNPYK